MTNREKKMKFILFKLLAKSLVAQLTLLSFSNENIQSSISPSSTINVLKKKKKKTIFQYERPKLNLNQFSKEDGLVIMAFVRIIVK